MTYEMLDLKLIRDNPEEVKKGVEAKGYPVEIVDEVANLDVKRRQLIQESENLKAQRNKLTKDDIQTGKKIKQELKKVEPQLKTVEDQLFNKLNAVPNLPLDIVPPGKNEKENEEVRKWGKPRKFDFPVKDHIELGKSLNILDFETGAKVTGSQFYFLYNEGALLELALIQYAFNLLQEEGFTPVITPDLARSRYYLGTGYSPKGNEAQTYTVEGDNEKEKLGLVATAEVTLAGKHADEIIPEEKLPLKYIGYSHCFRQEAGAYGKYSKGLYRVHQFTKAEMFIYCLPQQSKQMHEYLLAVEEKIYQGLGLPYRILEMCTGDLGAMAARKFDLECWMPGRNEYGEVTSTSNCTDYQARNLNIRVKNKNGSIQHVHMLNGTAIATSRVIIAILENYQNADGSVTVPETLRKYIGKKIISR